MMFRRILTIKHVSSQPIKFRGVGLTVEADETHICKQKYNDGLVLSSEAVWIVGEVCWDQKKYSCKNYYNK